MTSPEDIFDSLAKDEKQLDAEIDRIQRVRQLFSKNRYDGEYRRDFEDVYENILEAKDAIEDKFSDGFQFGDLEDVLVAAAPVFKDIYDEFYDVMMDDKEAQDFLKDLVIFIYYEVEDKIKGMGWLKGLFRVILKLYLANKAAKYMKLAFDYANRKVVLITDKARARVDKFFLVLK